MNRQRGPLRIDERSNHSYLKAHPASRASFTYSFVSGQETNKAYVPWEKALLAGCPKLFRDSLKTTPNISFLADGSNVFPQALATRLPVVTFRFTRQTLQTLLQLLSFWAGLFSLFPDVRRSSKFKIYFLAQNNKNKKYENALAATDFVTKELAWFWLDNFDSQTFHSWVGFA